VKIVSRPELVHLARLAVKRHRLIGGGNADGFLIDVDHALYEIGLSQVEVKKTEQKDCRFRVTALYDGDPREVAARIIAALDERVAYSGEDAKGAWTITDGVVEISFLTALGGIGAATVCIRAARIDSRSSEETIVDDKTPRG
jgi:hypothetical protein